MLHEKNNKNAALVFWILSVVCMGVIFYFSSRTAVESSDQSSSVLNILKQLFGENAFTDFIVRKSAHCLEFTGLALLFNFALYFTYQRKKPIMAIIITSAYAVTDELHQLFVEGRSCEIRDWTIDTAGAIIGTLGFFVLIYIINLISKKFIKYN